MESLKNTTQVQNLQKELLKNYHENLRDPSFKELVLKLHLDDKIGAINNSQLEDSVKEIKNCKDCKGLYFCKNKVMGHYLYPKKTSNILDLVYVHYKYKK